MTVVRWRPYSTTVPFSPPYSTAWDGAGPVSSRQLMSASPQAWAIRQGAADAYAAESPRQEYMGQFLGPELPAGPMVGTFRSAWRVGLSYFTESATAYVVPRTLRTILRVFSAAGVDRGVIFDGVSAVTTTAREHTLTVGGTLTGGVVAQAGDYLVVDLGGQIPQHTGNLYPPLIRLEQYLANAGVTADLPYVDQDATLGMSWVELNLPQITQVPGIGAAHVQAVRLPARPPARLGALHASAVRLPDRPPARLGSMHAQVLLRQGTTASLEALHAQVMSHDPWVVSASDGETAIQVLHTDGVWRPLHLME